MEKTIPPKPWKERKAGIRYLWAIPFIFVEWNCERLSYNLGKWAFLEILEQLGRLTILVGIIFWCLERDDRKQAKEDQRKTKHYQAWQAINSAYGKHGDGGRINALQDLSQDNVSLISVNLSQANLTGINLRNADLRATNLSDAYLFGANLGGADLRQANLNKAYLFEANLSKARFFEADCYLTNFTKANLNKTDFRKVNLQRANFHKANLNEANLIGADFRQATLTQANFQGADLSKVDLREADLHWADLSNSNLSEVNFYASNLKDIQNWQKIKSIRCANIYGAKNAPEGFVEWAKKNGAVSFEKGEEWENFIKEQGSQKVRE